MKGKRIKKETINNEKVSNPSPTKNSKNPIIKKEGKKRTKFGKLPKYARIIIITVLSLVVVVGLCTASLFIYIGSINNSINSVTTSEIENILAPVESPKEPVTILILGRDSRDSENERGRADTIMLMYLK
jgi:predicted PurR-regulated permease PerM